MSAQFNLDTKHYKKILKNVGTQISHSDLTNGVHQIALDCSNALAKRIGSALRKGKAVRIPKGSAVIGGSIVSSVKKLSAKVPKSFVRDVAKIAIDEGLKAASGQGIMSNIKKAATKKQYIKNVGNLVLHEAVQSVPDEFKGVAMFVGNKAVKKAAEQGSGIVKTLTKKSLIKKVGNLAVTEAAKAVPDDYKGITMAVGKAATNQIAEKAGSSLVGNIGRMAGKELSKKYVPKELQGISNGIIDAGLKSKGMGLKPKKGSAEMKAKMAALRAMKKGGKVTAGWNMGNVNDGLKIAAPIWKKAAKVAAPVLGLGVGELLGEKQRKYKRGGSFLAPSSRGGSFKSP